MKRTIFTLIAWFAALCVWSVTETGIPSSYDQFKTTEYRYASKIHFPSDGIIRTYVGTSFMNEGASVRVIRSEFKFIARGYNQNHPINAMIGQDLLYCSVSVSGNTYPYVPIDITGNTWLNISRNKEYNFSKKVSSKEYIISYSQIQQALKTQCNVDLDKESGCVELKFRFGVYAHMERDKGEPAEFKFYIQTTESETFKIYLCRPGDISFEVDKMPVLEQAAGKEIKALYPTSNGSAIAFNLLSKEAPSHFPEDYQKLVWTVRKKEIEVAQKTTTSNRATIQTGTFAISGMSFDYGELSENGILNEGDLYSVTRTISTLSDIIKCTSEPIECRVVKEARLRGFENKELKVCPGIGELSYDGKEDSYDDQTKWLHIEGNRLNVDSVSYSSVYDARYAWEYKNADAGNWVELPMNEGVLNIESQYNCPERFSALYNSAPQDLVVPLHLLKGGMKYKFRQVAYLGGFDNRRIVAKDKGEILVSVYDTITKPMFDVSHMSAICADNSIHDNNVKISLRDGMDVKSISPSLPGVMKYQYSFPLGNVSGSSESESLNLDISVFADKSQKAYATFTVEDGCGAQVILMDSLIVNELPVLDINHILCSNASTSILDGVFVAEVADGASCVIRVSSEDADFSISDYLYSEDDKSYNKIGSRGLALTLNTSSSKRVYLKKRSRLGSQCESDPVAVDLVKVGELHDNRITDSNYYVCANTQNPSIVCDRVSGGYGVGTYTYKWIYSTDDNYYKPMMSGENLVTTMNLSAGQWDQLINSTYYIKRIVISKRGDGVISDTSAYAVITPYSKPIMTLKAEKINVCYDSLVTLTMSQDTKSLSELSLSSAQGRAESMSYSYVTKGMDGVEHIVSSQMTEVDNTYDLRINMDTVAYAKLNVCGSDFYSSPISITSGANLRPKMSYGECRVRGSELEINVVNPEADWTYSIEQNGKSLGGITAEVKIPEVGSLSYVIRVTNGSCEHVGQMSVDDNLLHDAFRHYSLEVNQVNGQIVNLCAGELATIANDHNEGNRYATNYEWSVDGVPVEKNDTSFLSYTFPLTSKLYKIVRESKEIRGKEMCQSIIDTVYVKTYGEVQGATLTLDNTGYICPGDSVKWTLGGVSGGSMNSYNYILTDNDENIGSGIVGLDEERSEFVKFSSAGKHTLKAVFTDNFCNARDLYAQTSSPKSVTQGEEASLSLSVSPSLVNEDGSGKSTVVTITATDGEADLTLDEFTYSYKKADGKVVSGKSVGGVFSIDIDSTSFTNDLLVVDVTRKVDVTGCMAQGKVTISQTQGFTQRPSLEISSLKGEYCSGEEVVFSISELPNFGDIKLKTKDVSFAWLKNGSLAGSDTIFKLKAVAGQSVSVMCMISYKYDASLRAAKVYSEEYELVGKPGIMLGKVTEAGSGSRSKSLCLNDSVSQFSLIVDAKVGVMDKLEWQQSLDGELWSPIPDSCRVGGDLTNGQSIDLLAQHYTKDQRTKYFRLKGISECGVESYSTNIFSLKIESVPSIPQVALRSENLINGKVKSLAFSPTSNYAGYSYHWGIVENDLNQVSSLNGAQAVVEGDFGIGNNSVYVYKQAIGGAQCVSPALKYDFNLYEELSIGDLTPTKKDTVRCPSENNINLNIADVLGGTGNYTIVWQYKTYGDNWISFNESSENLGFKAKFDEGSFMGSYQFGLSIAELSTTTSFRAIIGCDGEYSGTSKITNAYTVNYFDPLKSGNVDLREETVCYGTKMSQIKGDLPSGGDGVYTFQWLRSTNPEMEDSWEVITNATSQSYNKCDTMFVGAFFKRVVTDGCGTTLESRVKHIDVLPMQEIRKEDVNYAKVVRAGNGAKMWGVPRSANDKSLYVWYDSEFQVLDTTSTREIYTTEEKLSGGDDFKTYIYYAAKYDEASGCVSHNFDTLVVTAFENVSGTIYVEGTEQETENNFWVCSGDQSIEVGSKSDPSDADFRWYYRVTTNANDAEPIVGDWSLLRGRELVPVRGARLSLDTCDASDLFTNATGHAKFVELKRVAKFIVAEEETSAESNVIRINVVPTMKSVNVLYDIVGSLSTDQNRYCLGDKAVKVRGEVENDSETMIVWKNMTRYFGPWLYDKDYNKDFGFATWYECRAVGGEWDTVSLRYFNMNGYTTEFMPGEGANHEMNKTYNVRRAVYDGCTSAYTDILPLYVIDEVGKVRNIQMYIIDDGDRNYKGYEIGDSLQVNHLSTDVYDCLWSLDSTFADTLEAVNNYISFRIEGSSANKLLSDPHIYMKRKSDGCWSSTLAIPVPLGSASDGGKIGYDQTICLGSEFGPIRNISEASGEWKSPVDAPMKWFYRWQFSIDSLSWANVNGADSIVLSSEDVNRYANLLNGKVTYFRRVAVNDSLRVRFSNVVKMTFYDEIRPGSLSLNTEKTGFCTYDELPTVISTAPTGGRTDEDGVNYAWYVNMDKGEYYECDGFKMNSFNLLFEDSLMTADRSNNILVNVKCRYQDVCGTAESEPITISLYRDNKIPNIYQDNDSCDALEVNIKVIEDAYDKSYFFVAMLDSETAMDSVIWSSETKERTIRRQTTMVVDQYAVYSVDETGCQSDYRYFNIDSLPELQQEEFSAPDVVCYNEGFTIVGGTAVGGNGEKSYVWQYSYDGNSWEDFINHTGENLEVVNPKVSTYYRRIALDMCDVDTSASILVHVRDEVKVSPEDITLYDFKCEGQSFNVNLSQGIKSQQDLDFYSLDREGYGLIRTFHGISMDGFYGDSIMLTLYHTVVDSTMKACVSEHIAVYAHNAVRIDHDQNIISCTNLTPCNGMVVDVVGERQGGTYADRLDSKWYISKDGQTWAEQLLQTGDMLRLRVQDTMYVRRLLSNGCVYDTSNTVTIIGTKVVEYDYLSALNLTVVSDVADSSVTMNISGAKSFSENYYFVGDGVLPQADANTILLPYKAETYKDSVLQVIAVSDVCVSQYEVTPLRGGVISFDGESTLCGGSDIPSIVSTDMEGGHGEYSYQWQYRNQYTGNYINIEGATGKEYTPQAVSVATDYRRLTMDGEYSSVSNAITVNIRPLPKIRGIYVAVVDSVLNSMGLNRTQYSIEKLPSMSLDLLDSITDVDLVTWQKSYDATKWENLETVDANGSDVYSMEAVDTTTIVYYRAIGVSECGADTSKAFKVTTLYASFITDDELVLVDSICKGDPYVRIAYKADYSDMFEYSYRTIGYQGSGVFEMPSNYALNDDLVRRIIAYDSEVTDTTRVRGGAIFTLPESSFDVEITRYVKKTGASSTKMVHFFVNELSATFSYLVDGVDSHMAGEDPHSVRINQGSKVTFIPKVTTLKDDASLSYKWWLVNPLNVDFYNTYGGSEGREGVTSPKESPSCYFYNPLDYTIKMTVTDGMCTATVVDSAMYIDKSTFRHYLVDASFDEEDEVSIAGKRNFSVYPNPCVDFLHVTTESLERVELFDTKGVLLFNGDGGDVYIDMRTFLPGLYLLKVSETSCLILKK